MEFPEVSPDKTHHVYRGVPIYSQRFLEVYPYQFPGLAAVRDESGWYHIDFQGNPVYTKRYAGARAFHDGIAAVQLNSGLFVYIDSRGYQIDPLEFIWAGDFQERIACVYHAEFGATHITTSGELLYNDWYYDVRSFMNGKAAVRNESGWYFIDKKGTRLGKAEEPDDRYPRGKVCKKHAENPIPAIIAAHSGYDACVILLRHAEREPFYAGEEGSDKLLTMRGIADAQKLAKNLPPLAKGYTSPVLRCVQTAELMDTITIQDTRLGKPGEFIYDEVQSSEYYKEYDTISAIRSYLNGAVLPGHYPVEEGARYFLHHICQLAEEGKFVVCVSHDIFVVACIGVVSGYRFENDWIDFLDGCVLFKYGTQWKLSWRGGEYLLPQW